LVFVDRQASAAANNLPLAQQEYVVNLYANRIQQFNSDINQDLAHKIAFNLLDISEKNDVDPRLSFALISQESRFNPRAVSPVGALGLGQLMPGTASSLGVNDPFDVTDNLNGTIRYLSSMLKRYGHLSLALAAYNAGPGNVSKYGGVPPFRETQNYVKVIWKRYARLAGLDPISGQQIAVQ
jgi:soluble lytic murein transglycosylase-like protein